MSSEIKLDALVNIGQVIALEESMHDMPKVDIPVKHYFAGGVYAREITIPKGTVLTGHIHKFEQINILSCGEMSVTTDHGVMRVKAPFTIVSPAGTKRAAFAHEDCVWTTLHGTNEIDIDLIEKKFIAKTYDEYLVFCENKQLIGG